MGTLLKRNHSQDSHNENAEIEKLPNNSVIANITQVPSWAKKFVHARRYIMRYIKRSI